MSDMDVLPTLGDAMLDVFRAYGADTIFSSPGSEWSPVWEALAKAKAQDDEFRYINTRHEALAVNVAWGYHRQTGKLPIVLLHATVGPLHAAMALRAVRHERLPMVVLTGESAGFGEISDPDPGPQWPHMLSDVGGPAVQAHPFVKRSITVTSPEALLGMLQDACRLALTAPFGPVLVSVPLEFMFGRCHRLPHPCPPPPVPAQPAPDAIERIAAALCAAQRPIIVTEYAGRTANDVRALVEVAECLGAGVVETNNPRYMNFPRRHPLHQGFEVKRAVAASDFVLLAGTQTPWYPSSWRPNQARVVLIDEHPGSDLLPYWGYAVDEIVAGDLGVALRQLRDAVADRAAKSGPAASADFWTARAAGQRGEWASAAEGVCRNRPIDTRWLMHVLGASLPPDTVVTEEVILQKALMLRELQGGRPGTFHGRNAGGLGIGLGLALGLRLGAAGPVVTVIGDGCFNYNPVLAAFGCAQEFGLPICVLIMNNGGYGAMRLAHQTYYPEGWSARTDNYYGHAIAPSPNYVAIAEAYGGYGEKVEEPDAIAGALARGLDRVRSGRLAVLDVVIDPDSPIR